MTPVSASKHEDPMDAAALSEQMRQAQQRYESMTSLERAIHDDDQRLSFVRGMLPFDEPDREVPKHPFRVEMERLQVENERLRRELVTSSSKNRSQINEPPAGEEITDAERLLRDIRQWGTRDIPEWKFKGILIMEGSAYMEQIDAAIREMKGKT